MTNFKLSCCYMLDRFPLFNYRTLEDDLYRLSVLLIGTGTRLETLWQTIIPNGQLLNTELDLTVINERISKTCASYLNKAPELKNYARIFHEDKQVSNPEYCYATLRFECESLQPENMKTLLEKRSECSYILISTGNDERNFALAQACAQFFFGHPAVIGYVQRKVPKREISSVSAYVVPFGMEKEEEPPVLSSILKKAAFNVHYSYAKQANERKSLTEIQKEFQDPYNYISSMLNIVHLRSKLACCGIELNSAQEAAAAFFAKMEKQPEVTEQLAALEHRRWIFEKLLSGYTQITDLNLLYSAPTITTHDNKQKWHCCLLPYEAEKQQLSFTDWNDPAPELRNDFDPLDRMTLIIHKKCGELAQHSKLEINRILHDLRSYIAEQIPILLETEYQFELVISQLWQNKRSAISLYHKYLLELEHSEASEQYSFSSRLEMLKTLLAPLVEYVSCKDYKEQDRVLIQSIPFVLTFQPSCTLIKLLSDDILTNLISTLYLNPKKLEIIGCIQSINELYTLKSKAESIQRFLNNRGSNLNIAYRILYTNDLADIDNLISDWNCTLYSVSQLDPAYLQEQLAFVMEDIQPDYIDMTAGEPSLVWTIEQYAQKHDIPFFYSKNGHLLNLNHAPEVAYHTVCKNITISEMFDLNGAVLKGCDSSTLSDLSDCYQELWDFVYANHTIWMDFCAYFKEKCKLNSFQFKFLKSGTFYTASKQFIVTSVDAANALLPVLRQAEVAGYLSDVFVEPSIGSQSKITFTVSSGYADPEKLTSWLRKYTEKYSPSVSYSWKRSNGLNVITYQNLSMNMTLPKSNRSAFSKILRKLKKLNLLSQLTISDDCSTCSVVFASEVLFDCLKVSGKVLENYLYHTTLFNSHFDDVAMGWSFIHSAEIDAANNEIDIICTKGMTSLFISAKMRSRSVLTEGNNLNYILYEISLLAKQFGINAKPVLAAPFIPQFQNNADGSISFSKEVKQALKRGVYLLGDACFQPDILGKVLDNIADGIQDWCPNSK